MPSWTTVVIALGGAAVGALAGITGSFLAYRGTKLDLTHQEHEAWRKVLIEACNALSDAWLELRWLLYPPSIGFGVFEDEARLKLNTLGTRCAQGAARAIVLFGRDSQTGKAASEVDDRIAELKDEAIRAPSGMWDEEQRERIHAAIKTAEAAHEAFQRMVQGVIQPLSWPPRERGRWQRLRRR